MYYYVICYLNLNIYIVLYYYYLLMFPIFKLFVYFSVRTYGLRMCRDFDAINTCIPILAESV